MKRLTEKQRVLLSTVAKKKHEKKEKTEKIYLYPFGAINTNLFSLRYEKAENTYCVLEHTQNTDSLFSESSNDNISRQCFYFTMLIVVLCA